MTRRPWYKRDGAAFIQGTMGLSLELKGAYSLCLDLIYANGGPIKDDARWLSGVCGVSMRKWDALRSALIERGKLFAQDGYLMNARAVTEIASLEVDHSLAVENGSKGGRNRAERSANAQRNNTEIDARENKNSDLGQASLNQKREDKNREDNKEEEKVTAIAVAPVSRETSKALVVVRSLPDWLPLDPWNGYLEMRKKIRMANTDRAIGMLLKRLEDLRAKGHDPTAILDEATIKNWKSLYEPKSDQGYGTGRQRPPSANDKNLAGAALAIASFSEDDDESGEAASDRAAGGPLLPFLDPGLHTRTGRG